MLTPPNMILTQKRDFDAPKCDFDAPKRDFDAKNLILTPKTLNII